MALPRPIDGILNISPYVGGDATVEGVARTIKLSANEGALGASPRAIEAFKQAADNLHRYPDGGSEVLRRALSEFYDLKAANIILGNGSDEIITTLCHAYLAPGDEIVYSAHGFLMYPLAAMAAGGKPVAAPEIERTASVDNILDTIGEKTKIVFLANPNNPTGSYIPVSEIRRLRQSMPEDVLLVVDCAYAEFVTRNDYSPCIELVEEYDNVLVTRTFSKIYGLAAVRLGWAYCPEEVAQVFHRVRTPFNVNQPAQAAGVAALQDVAHSAAARAHNEQWLPWLDGEFKRFGLETIPSVGNFIAVQFPGTDGKSAEEALAFLAARGILPRPVGAYDLAGFLRFTIGLEEENRAVADAVAEFLER